MENAITDTKFHVRMVSVCTILAAIDGYLIYGAVVSVQTTGPSMQLLFGFEYIALAVAIVTSFIKYCLNAADTYSGDDTPWEAKKQYFSYLDLLSDFLKLIVYISFFLILMNFYGPLHAHAAHRSTRLHTAHAPQTSLSLLFQPCSFTCSVCAGLPNSVAQRYPPVRVRR